MTKMIEELLRCRSTQKRNASLCRVVPEQPWGVRRLDDKKSGDFSVRVDFDASQHASQSFW